MGDTAAHHTVTEWSPQRLVYMADPKRLCQTTTALPGRNPPAAMKMGAGSVSEGDRASCPEPANSLLGVSRRTGHCRALIWAARQHERCEDGGDVPIARVSGSKKWRHAPNRPTEKQPPSV
jgi:hypothetical protein